MKKLALTFAIVLGLGMASFAQDGGLFNRGYQEGEEGLREVTPIFPGHDYDENQSAPLGSGALMLIGLGAAYAMSKKNKK
jgi:hypothetical protein